MDKKNQVMSNKDLENIAGGAVYINPSLKEDNPTEYQRLLDLNKTIGENMRKSRNLSF